MRFEVLGPIRLTVDRDEIAISAGRERALLAMLLLHAPNPVSADRLIDAVWTTTPPRDARNQLQGSVSRLRRQLIDAGITDQVIVTGPAGYHAAVGPTHLDLLEFRQRIAEARAAKLGRPEQAGVAYRAALSLWRGPALAGIDNLPIRRVATALDEDYLQVLQECLEAELNAGGGGGLVGELTGLVQQHPHREGFHRSLMLALYRAGRQADALAAYRQARQQLLDDLGTEPGRELQQLHQAILNHDPSLDAAASARPSPASTVPRTLPGDIAGFAGRVQELRTLDKLISAGEGTPRPVVISAIGGTAGVGKTALTVHWAHHVSDRFPDGQLYVNLRGFDPDQPPMEPARAIHGFLDALQVSPQRMPGTLEARVGLYRSLLAERRMLIVLDNARDAAQVRPLLPGALGCLVVVTSRNQLTSLVATEGALPITLDALDPAEARQLLANRLGAERLAPEPEAVDEIIARCARLPLALAIAAARAAFRSELPLRELAQELRSARTGLDALSDPDPAADLRATFDLSYRALSVAGARLFRLLGLHPGPDISAAAAASLLGHDPDQIHPVLAELTRAHLLDEPAPDRYRFHDLLRAYAAELAHAHDREESRRQATRRMLDHYLHTAHAAAMLVYTHRRPITLIPAQPEVVPEELADHEQALAWLTAEYAVLLAAIDQAARSGFDAHAWQLAWALGTYFDRRGHWHDWLSTYHTALDAARQCDDRAGQANIHRGLSLGCIRLGYDDDALTHLQRSIDLFGEVGDRLGQAENHATVPMVLERKGDYQRAIDHMQRATELYQAINHRPGQALCLNGLGWLWAQLGNYRQAAAYCRQALSLQQGLGDSAGQAHTWDSLGYAHHHLGEYREASDCYREALALFRDMGDRYYEADTLTHFGDTHHAGNDHDAAREAWRQALAILEELDHPEAGQVRTKLHQLEPK